MMRIAARILSLIVLAAFATFYVSCKGPDDPTESETDAQIQLLNGTWNLQSATFEGDAPDLDHSAFKLTLSGTTGTTPATLTYTVTGRPAGPSAWPSNGNFVFGANVKQDLVREDGINVNYTVTATTLQMTFTFDKAPYTSTGRTESVSGEWTFNFTK